LLSLPFGFIATYIGFEAVDPTSGAIERAPHSPERLPTLSRGGRRMAVLTVELLLAFIGKPFALVREKLALVCAKLALICMTVAFVRDSFTLVSDPVSLIRSLPSLGLLRLQPFWRRAARCRKQLIV
jgi:hypothetical protein